MSKREGLVIGALIVTLLAILLIGASSQISRSGHQFCSAEARIQPDGSTIGRSSAHNCQFVDSDGNVIGN